MRIKTLLFLFGAFLLIQNARSQCADLFISQYIEGGGSNKGIELYNPSTETINLSNYEIFMIGNGGTFMEAYSPVGTIAPGGTYVIVNGGSDSVMRSVADVEIAGQGVVNFNGDDALGIINTGTGDTVDVFGVLFMDPGSSWAVDTAFTRDFTLVRKASVDAGSTDWTVGATQWDILPKDDFTGLGTHTGPAATLPACVGEACVDLFISEYIEGSSNNKGIEIYNPSTDTADLSNYEVLGIHNGGSSLPQHFPVGKLAPGDVYIIVTDQADSIMKSRADVELPFRSPVHFNGDDAVVLINTSTGDTIDVIGEKFVRPTGSWPVDTGATAEYTLVRKPEVLRGSLDWAVGATQWLVSPQNTFDSLGAHSTTLAPMGTLCVGEGPVAPEVSFSVEAIDISEGDSTVDVIVELAAAGTDTVMVTVGLGTGTATNGADFAWTDTTISLDAVNTSDTITVAITDDTDIESIETIVLELSNPTNGAVLVVDSVLTITIEDNDYLQYPIGLLTADSDSIGVGDSLGVRTQVQGIVYGIDFQGGSRYSFTLIDSTGGINIFANNETGYVVTEGDEIIAGGVVDSYNGLTELIVEDIQLLSQGNQIADPTPVSWLNESTESEYVILGCVTIVDTLDWPSDPTAGSSNIEFTNGVDTFIVRIDSDAAIRGNDYPTGNWFNIRGVGGQFDSNTPALGGYQLFPDSLNDFIVRNPVIGFTSDHMTVIDTATTVADVVVVAWNNNPDTTTITVSLGAGTTATIGTDFNWTDSTFTVSGCDNDSVALPLEVIGDTDAEGPEWVELVITSVNNNATVSVDTITVRLVETTVGISTVLPANAIKLYPNPAQDQIILDASVQMERITVVNLVGQTLLNIEDTSVEQRIDISQLPAGIYTVRVETAEGLWVSKLLKK